MIGRCVVFVAACALAGCSSAPEDASCGGPGVVDAVTAVLHAELDAQLVELGLSGSAGTIRANVDAGLVSPHAVGLADGQTRCTADLVVHLPARVLKAFADNRELFGAIGGQTLVLGSSDLRGAISYRVAGRGDALHVEAVEGHRIIAEGIGLGAVLGAFDAEPATRAGSVVAP